MPSRKKNANGLPPPRKKRRQRRRRPARKLKSRRPPPRRRRRRKLSNLPPPHILDVIIPSKSVKPTKRKRDLTLEFISNIVESVLKKQIEKLSEK